MANSKNALMRRLLSYNRLCLLPYTHTRHKKRQFKIIIGSNWFLFLALFFFLCPPPTIHAHPIKKERLRKVAWPNSSAHSICISNRIDICSNNKKSVTSKSNALNSFAESNWFSFHFFFVDVLSETFGIVFVLMDVFRYSLEGLFFGMEIRMFSMHLNIFTTQYNIQLTVVLCVCLSYQLGGPSHSLESRVSVSLTTNIVMKWAFSPFSYFPWDSDSRFNAFLCVVVSPFDIKFVREKKIICRPAAIQKLQQFSVVFRFGSFRFFFM